MQGAITEVEGSESNVIIESPTIPNENKKLHFIVAIVNITRSLQIPPKISQNSSHAAYSSA